MDPGSESKKEGLRRIPKQVSAIALASILAVIGHLPSLANGFTVDDFTLVVHNPHVRTFKGLLFILRSELFFASAQPRFVPYYRPLSGASYWASWQLFGDNPMLHHALNLGLHALLVGCFTLLMIRAGLHVFSAMLGAIILAVHPATADIVAYLGGRQDLLGWTTIMVSGLLILRSKNLWTQAAAAFFGSLCAGFFREFFWIAPFLFPLFSWMSPGGRFASDGSVSGNHRSGDKKAGTVFFAGTLAVLFTLGIRKALGVGQLVDDMEKNSSLIGCGASTALRFLRNTIAPTDLAIDISCVPLANSLALLVLGTGGLALVAVVVCLAKTKAGAKVPLAIVGVIIIAAGVGIHGAHGVRYGAISDRYTYSFLIAVVLFGVSLAEHAVQVIRTRTQAENSPLFAVGPWLLLAAPLTLLPLTWARDQDWKSEETLQIAMWRDRPQDPLSQYAEGMRLFNRGDYEAAYTLCEAYRQAAPRSDRANLCVASYLYVKGRAAEAVPLACEYARIRPGNDEARRLCLASLLASGQFQEAKALISDWSAIVGDSSEIIEAREVLQQVEGRTPSP